MSVMNKAIKYRIYPTTEQATLFAKTFGCCRKIYNLMLADKIFSYKKTGDVGSNHKYYRESQKKQGARLLVAE